MKSANNSANTNGRFQTLIAFEGPALFFSLHFSCTAASGWIQLFDSRTLPRAGDRPKREWPIVEFNVFDHETTNGIPMQNGIVVAVSSTQHSYTAYDVQPIIDVSFYVPPADAPPKTDPTPLEPATKPAPAPQRPLPASTPAGRPAPTTKPLRGAVAALLLAFLALLPSGRAASDLTGIRTATATQLYPTGFTTVSNANTLYVAIGGDNSTGKRGRPDKPYASPKAAVNAAVAGDTIEVFPGTYTTNNLLKNGVNWIGRPGAVITYTNVVGDGGVGIFDDRFGAGAVTSSISGFSFVYSAGTQSVDGSFLPCCGPTNVNGCLVITNPLSQINFAFDRIVWKEVGSLNQGAALYLRDGTNCFVRGNLIQDPSLTTQEIIGFDTDIMQNVVVESQGTGLYWGAGDHHVDVKRIEMRRYSIYSHGHGTNTVGDLHFTGDFLYGKFYSDGTFSGPNWRVWLNFNELKCDLTNNSGLGAVNLLGAGKIYIRAEKIGEIGTKVLPTGGTAVYMTDTAMCWLNVQKLAAGSLFFNLNGAATLFADVNQFEDLGYVATDGISVSGATLRLKGGQPLAAVAGTGGALTNFTLLASQPKVSISGTTNVSIRAVMDYGSDLYGRPAGDWLWNVTITNGSGVNRTLEFSPVTNRWRFAGTYGTNAPNVLTNATALLLSGRSVGTNVQVGYSYFAWP